MEFENLKQCIRALSAFCKIHKLQSLALELKMEQTKV